MGVTAVMLPDLEFDEQIALCQEPGIRHYQYRSRVIAPEQRDKPWGNWGNHKFDLTPERLVRDGASLTRRLRAAGIEPWGTVPVCSADIKLILETHCGTMITSPGLAWNVVRNFPPERIGVILNPPPPGKAARQHDGHSFSPVFLSSRLSRNFEPWRDRG